ncbi:type IVB secretion system apparatus protein IcmL/DotI [Legionella spiritensis]|uniref:Protein IcmL (DotI) n=1 Tax=Legionella spiritensis TaxID=452 RepID=A0A0W0ZAL8_LEGSP|nr:type IVB secretion system apparatus protein IcmL/DotI [Legionella spiritensis]KTD66073.1 protein IcmL (DotI) [Legionella spiritensis]SNV44358.1 protein IcmL (DotI) [Legionella spiritensis]VEG90791.1 protein IcmL (DotI) [Legionella spiritensis]
MPQDALTAVNIRNQFYKSGQRKVTLVLLASIACNIMFFYLLLYIVYNPPGPRYFPTGINGRITRLYPLTEPNQSNSSVLQWAGEAAVAAFTYNYVNYRQELQASSGFFTAKGWELFLNALDESNNLEAVKQKKLIVSAVATSAPAIKNAGFYQGRYSWRIEVPVLVTYQSATEYTQQNNMVTMVVTRVSTLNSPSGIGIAQFVVSPLS